MSSHLLADLERVCDHIVILAHGETQLCGEMDHVLETHKLLLGPAGEAPTSDDYAVIRETRTSTATHAVVRLKNQEISIPDWHVRDVDIEQIVLAYMRQSKDETTSEGGAR
jgi:ABC-2 type transport system ATP-binding protein